MRAWFINCVVALVLSVNSANAFDGVLYAGSTLHDDPSGYLGLTHALPGSTLGKGFAYKIAASGGRYEYVSNVGAIRARYYSANVSIAYQESGPWGWATFSVGPRYTKTTLSSDDPFNHRAGSRLDAVIAIDGAFLQEPFDLRWYAETGPRDRSYLAKIQATRVINLSKLRVGFEVTVQGDEQYDRQGIGAVIAKNFSSNMELQLSTGVTFQGNDAAQPYLSINISKLL